MTERFTPTETLQHYFDELLSDDELLGKPQASAPVVPASRFADPHIERQRQLTRLLQTAQPQLITATPVAPVVVEATPVMVEAEIQEWEVEPSDLQVSPELPELETPALDHDLDDELPELQEASSYQIEGLEWLENGRPAWAQTRFDVLLFQVSGLTLAVPLISLGQIQPLTDELTPLFGQADWFMGLQPTAAGKIRTVNTAKFVMPERYDESFVETAKYVVSINGVPWGLAVDTVNQPISLEPEDVKWRSSERSKRPWLAGTVKAHMCALLDIPRIGQILMDADRNTGKQAGYQ